MYRINTSPIKESYVFIKEIGRGASGVCYEVECSRTKKRRCCKQINNNNNKNYPKQIQFLRILSHPGIIRLYQVYESKSSFYLITDLCEGGDLYDYLSKYGAVSEEFAKNILLQILLPLQYCHQMKICHRDLKPQNFLVLQKAHQNQIPNIKMIDFDLAFQWKTDITQQILVSQGKKLKGTPYYIAPEVINGQYNQKCDIWSAGVILHILLTGKAPFEGATTKHILERIKTKKLNLAIPQFQDVSLLVKDLLKKMLCPQDQRISLKGIFQHPWMKIKPKKTKFKVDFGCLVKFSKFGKLKKIVAEYLATQMTAKQLSKVECLFHALDKNHDGFICQKQIEAGIQAYSQKQKLEELKNLLNFIENNGCINFNEFVATFIKQKSINCEKNLRKVFNMIDNDGNGFIQTNQLKDMLSKVGARKKPLRSRRISQDAKDIFKISDKNNDGKIDFEEFKITVVQGIQF